MTPNVSCSMGNATIQKPKVDYMTFIESNLDYYLVPVIIFIGLLGNTLSFMVFVFTNLKSLSSSVYLAALSISDNGFLICVCFSWFINIKVTIYHQQGWCQTFVYLTYVFSFLSVWYVVAFTTERWIVVLFPFKRGDMCTVKRANIVVISLAILGFAAYNFAIWTPESIYITNLNGTERRGPYCRTNEDYDHLIFIINNIDTVVTLIMPSCIITVLNLQIIRAVTRINKDRHQVLYSQANRGRQASRASNCTINPRSPHKNKRHPGEYSYQGQTEDVYSKISSSKTRSVSYQGSPGPSTKRNHHTSNNQHRVTRLLLVVSSIFLLLNLPSHMIRLYFFIMSFINPEYIPTAISLLLQKIFTYLYYVNFSINFFLYSLCGNNFRKSLWYLLHRPCVALKGNLCSFQTLLRSRDQTARKEMSSTYKRQANAVVYYNNGRTTLTIFKS